MAALFTLILVVCVLFVGNAATAAVRGRRRELGARRARLAPVPAVHGSAIGELAGIGLAAGVLAAVIALPVWPAWA